MKENIELEPEDARGPTYKGLVEEKIVIRQRSKEFLEESNDLVGLQSSRAKTRVNRKSEASTNY